MLKVFSHLMESGSNHPFVTGTIGFISAMFSAFLGVVANVRDTYETFDDWVVRCASVTALLVSLLTVVILVGKIWKDSTIMKPKVFKFFRWLRLMHLRRRIYKRALMEKVSNVLEFFKRGD